MRVWTVSGFVGLVAVVVAACSSEAALDPAPDDAGRLEDASASGDAQDDASQTPDAAELPDAAIPADASSTECATDRTRCDERCVDLASDRAHCGACDQPCAAGSACISSTCIPTCTIDATPHPAGTVSPTNACERCDPDTSATSWSARPDGTACGEAASCRDARCIPPCSIDGQLYADGTPNPANGCEKCDASVSTTSWSPGYRQLLVGGRDVVEQGWTIHQAAPSTLSYGADWTELSSSTNPGGRLSGQLLISYPDAVDPATTFHVRAELQVMAVNRHNQLDAGAALLGAFTPPAGNARDRSQMIYLDDNAIGWSDDTGSSPMQVIDGAFHVYELIVKADGLATVSVDGALKLTRPGFTTNGRIALGDQTNDPNVDGTLRIRSVAVCNQ